VKRKGTDGDLSEVSKSSAARITHKHIDLNKPKVINQCEEVLAKAVCPNEELPIVKQQQTSTVLS
jgi:hypothetical protein